MGIVEVASLTTRVTMSPPETMTSTLSCTSSAASSGSRSSFSSADRYSMTMFFPSTYPRSCKPCRNASTRGDTVELETETKVRSPTVGTFLADCASEKVSAARRRNVPEESLNHGPHLPAQRLCHKKRLMKIV